MADVPVDLNATLDSADRSQGSARELLSSLVASRSVRGEASDIHELCAEQLAELGMEVEFVTPRVGELESSPEWCPPEPAVAERERLVSVVGSRGEGPGIFLFAHIDTEQSEPGDGWENDPLVATEIGGRTYGVGAADDKAGVVSVLASARALVPQLEAVRLVIGLVHGKLGGGLGTLPAMEKVGDVEAAVYCHPAETGRGMSQFKVATRGFFNFRVETEGRRPAPVEIRTPNSEDPRQGVNAFDRLRVALDAVEGWAAQEDDLLWSVNRVSAGENPTVLPEQAVAEGAVWFRHGTFTEVYERLAGAARLAGASSTRLFGVRSNPAEIPTDHPLVELTARAIAAETGAPPGVYPAHVASDIRFPIRCLNTPTVGFGALAGNFYGPNEWVDTNDMHRATRVLIRIVSSWADQATGGSFWPRIDR